MAAKSKVPKRISILAEDDLADTPELQELAERGHLVVSFGALPAMGLEAPSLAEFDLILSRSACAYAPGLEKWLADAIKGARSRRYGKKVGVETEV